MIRHCLQTTSNKYFDYLDSLKTLEKSDPKNHKLADLAKFNRTGLELISYLDGLIKSLLSGAAKAEDLNFESQYLLGQSKLLVNKLRETNSPEALEQTDDNVSRILLKLLNKSHEIPGDKKHSFAIEARFTSLSKIDRETQKDIYQLAAILIVELLIRTANIIEFDHMSLMEAEVTPRDLGSITQNAAAYLQTYSEPAIKERIDCLTREEKTSEAQKLFDLLIGLNNVFVGNDFYFNSNLEQRLLTLRHGDSYETLTLLIDSLGPIDIEQNQDLANMVLSTFLNSAFGKTAKATVYDLIAKFNALSLEQFEKNLKRIILEDLKSENLDDCIREKLVVILSKVKDLNKLDEESLKQIRQFLTSSIKLAKKQGVNEQIIVGVLCLAKTYQEIKPDDIKELCSIGSQFFRRNDYIDIEDVLVYLDSLAKERTKDKEIIEDSIAKLYQASLMVCEDKLLTELLADMMEPHFDYSLATEQLVQNRLQFRLHSEENQKRFKEKLINIAFQLLFDKKQKPELREAALNVILTLEEDTLAVLMPNINSYNRESTSVDSSKIPMALYLLNKFCSSHSGRIALKNYLAKQSFKFSDTAQSILSTKQSDFKALVKFSTVNKLAI